MAFNSETARLAGQKSKRGPSKKLHENIRKKMEILYEDVLDHLIIHQVFLIIYCQRQSRSEINLLWKISRSMRKKIILLEVQVL